MADTPASTTTRRFLGFSPTFWVANTMELFERGAYYGMNALLGRYLTDHTGGALGFSEDRASLLQSLVYAATYVVPILGGALAERYGYRRMLIFAFCLLGAGYFAAAEVSLYGAVLASLLVMAVGSGLFKPIISGTIARTTDERNAGFGFGLYYWMINLGALIAPLVAGWLKGFSWRLVFIASALYCAAMLLPTLFVYRDPSPPRPERRLGQVLNDAVIVLGDARFMLLVFVYSCFWVLYFQNFGTVLWYLRDFIDTTPLDAMLASAGIPLKFDAEHVTVVNAGTIVLLQVLVSRVVRDLKPLPTMMVGIFFGACGFALLASSTSIFVFIVGIATFSLGEMTCHPKYYAYIGGIAPTERKAIYMGYAFLYGVIGSLVGANLGGELYTSLLKPLVGMTTGPAAAHRFWALFAGLGLVTLGGLFLYDRLFGVDTKTTRARARHAMTVVYLLFVAAAFGVVALVLHSRGELPAKTIIQAVILVVIGLGGLAMLLGRREAAGGADG